MPVKSLGTSESRNTFSSLFLSFHLLSYRTTFALHGSGNSDPGSHGGPSSSLPTTVRAFIFTARRIQHFLPSSTRVKLYMQCIPKGYGYYTQQVPMSSTLTVLLASTYRPFSENTAVSNTNQQEGAYNPTICLINLVLILLFKYCCTPLLLSTSHRKRSAVLSENFRTNRGHRCLLPFSIPRYTCAFVFHRA